ncbi:LysR family transcriptional regulator [Labrys neptuniae]
MSDPRPTLDQLQVFLAIVEAGSFAGAARQLGRATSVVSYTIANLEAQLGLELFDRESTRKPQLTDAGKAMLSEARVVARGVGSLIAKAKGLTSGLEAEVTLTVDVMLPPCVLVQVLNAFQAEFPTVSLRLHVEALGAVTQHVLDGVSDLGVSGPLARDIIGIERRNIGAIRMIPVAAPSHPLAKLDSEQVDVQAPEHVQLVLTDRSKLTEGQEHGVVSAKTWRIADLGAKFMLLRSGIGWGSMPEEMVRDDVAAGRLARLAMTGWDRNLYLLQSVRRTDTALGPAGSWLLARLKAALGEDREAMNATRSAA